jgi:hypothetical protein
VVGNAPDPDLLRAATLPCAEIEPLGGRARAAVVSPQARPSWRNGLPPPAPRAGLIGRPAIVSGSPSIAHEDVEADLADFQPRSTSPEPGMRARRVRRARCGRRLVDARLPDAAVQVSGRNVTTVEGLAGTGELNAAVGVLGAARPVAASPES